MPLIAPFRGLRYDLKKVGRLSPLVTPPYDVISPATQTHYYKRHRWNFVRVVFGKSHASDTTARNRYIRARNTLGQWIERGILRFDAAPGVYPYRQDYTLQGRRHERWGVIALVRLDSPRIYPHEGTKEEPKRDRLRLLEAVEASLSPIFGLIPDPHDRYRRFIRKICRSSKPAGVANLDGVRHTLWRVSDPALLRTLQQLLKHKELIIADGHHRYEAALAYRNARRRRDPHFAPSAPYNFAMFYLSAAGAEEPGLLPTHRILQKLPRQRFRRFLSRMKARGALVPVADAKTLMEKVRQLRDRSRIGIGFTTGNGATFLLRGAADAPYDMDVEWLHREIVPRWIGSGAAISYTQDWTHGVRELRRGRAQALFVMQPPRLAQVFARARGRQRMPGKTTYFYPKPLAGLVEYKF